MRIVLALMAGAVAWMAVVASQSHAVGASRYSGAARYAGGTGRAMGPMLPGHYNRLASYYRIHLN
ncbi:MAG: hypothetical protein ACREJM_14030 [Candidatus Saccharimonadales bacterium]